MKRSLLNFSRKNNKPTIWLESLLWPINSVLKELRITLPIKLVDRAQDKVLPDPNKLLSSRCNQSDNTPRPKLIKDPNNLHNTRHHPNLTSLTNNNSHNSSINPDSNNPVRLVRLAINPAIQMQVLDLHSSNLLKFTP